MNKKQYKKYKKQYKMELKKCCKYNGKNYLYKKIIKSQNFIDTFNYLFNNKLDYYTVENSVCVLFDYWDKLWYWTNDQMDDFIYFFENKTDNYIDWCDDFFEYHIYGIPFN